MKEEVRDKQRVVFMGDDAKQTLGLASKILNRVNKEHDVILADSENHIGNAPMVLIENSYNIYEHHILVVGDINNSALNILESVADKTPKAGSIVFSSEKKEVSKICSRKRKDVFQIKYKEEESVHSYSGSQIAAIRALFNRIGIPEKQFSNALQSLVLCLD